MTTTRIALIDGQPLIRLGLSGLIGAISGLAVVGEADSCTEARNLCQLQHPDVAIVELDYRDGSGLDLIRTLKSTNQRLHVLVLSLHDERVWAERCLRAGASGYLQKDEHLDHVIAAIRCVSNGQRWLSRPLMAALVDRAVGGPNLGGAVATLSDRELEVFRSIGEGATTRVIADHLAVSVKTVEAHKANIKRKLHASDAGILARLAIEWATTGSPTTPRPPDESARTA